MLKKKERLSRIDFNRFFNSASCKRVHGKLLQIIYTPHPTFHASVVVSKKIARKAVARNKLRRQLYDMLRRFVRTNNGGVYIVLVKKPATVANYEALKTELLSLVERNSGGGNTR